MPKLTLTRNRQIRKYAMETARQWHLATVKDGVPCSQFTRFSKSFFAAVEEETKAAVTRLVLANSNHKKRRTLR